MSGFGSGRRNGRDATDGYRGLDVRRWQRDGLLTPNQTFGWQQSRDGEAVAFIRIRTEIGRVILDYRHRSGGEDWKDESYPVRLDWTRCNFGGERAWFRCLAMGCGRRVAIFYCGAVFAARHCYRLACRCQRETADDRAARRADRIQARLGWEPGILNGEGWTKRDARAHL